MASRNMTGPLYGPKYNSSDAQRQQAMAQQLLRAGVNTSPAAGGIGEVLARIGTAGIGGYLANQAGETEKEYNRDRAQTLARALSMGQDQTNLPGPNPDGSAGYNRPADPNAMAQILMGNPSTADLGANLAIGQMEFNRNRAAKKEDTAEERDFRKEMFGMERQGRMEDLYITQNFQKEMQAMNQAFAAGQQDKALAHASNLAQMQQKFTAAENEANRGFQQGENQLNRAATIAAQEPARTLTGYKILEEKKKLDDDAKSKQEAIVSVDRMIRSIDELGPSHPGFSGAVGIQSVFPSIPGGNAATYEAQLETLKSQAFLPMVAQLKGMGQLSDAEGKKLTAAIGALDPKMKPEKFTQSLNEIKADLEAARKRMGAPSESTVPRTTPATNLPALPPGFVPVQ